MCNIPKSYRIVTHLDDDDDDDGEDAQAQGAMVPKTWKHGKKCSFCCYLMVYLLYVE